MTVKEMRVVHDAINNAQNAIELLASENYPYTAFYDDEFGDMFYTLNRFCIAIADKIKKAESHPQT